MTALLLATWLALGPQPRPEGPPAHGSASRHEVPLAAARPAALGAAVADRGQETRDSETVRYKTFSEIVQEIAKGIEAKVEKPGEKALVVWLLDNATMLQSSKHGEMLAELIPRMFVSEKVKYYHAVLSMGEEPRLILKTTDDTAALSRAIEALSQAKPDDRIKNCLANVRGAAKYAGGMSGGKKYVVLFTQENGDNEDDLEGTLKYLKSGGVTLYPICGEAVYSDPYWESLLDNTTYYYSDSDKYKKLKFQLKGPESAYIEFPYGWPFVTADPAYTVPSGYGYFGLSRVATHTGGKYFVYNIDRSAFTFCQRYSCAVCSASHKDCGGSFDITKIKMTGPDVGSREQVRARYGRERLFVGILNIWDRLHRTGLIRGSPRLRPSGGTLQEIKAQPGSQNPFLFGNDWRANKAQALRAAADLDKITTEFAAAIDADAATADKRVLATAEALLVHLRVMRINLTQLALFCDEMDRILRARKPGPLDGFVFPLIDDFIGTKIVGYSYRNVFLCHGGAPLKDVQLLGGEAEAKEIRETLDYADKMIDRHRGTPWEVLIRRAALVIFLPAPEAKEAKTQRDRNRSNSDQTTTDTNATPNRPGRPTTGGGGGSGTASGN